MNSIGQLKRRIRHTLNPELFPYEEMPNLSNLLGEINAMEIRCERAEQGVAHTIYLAHRMASRLREKRKAEKGVDVDTDALLKEFSGIVDQMREENLSDKTKS